MGLYLRFAALLAAAEGLLLATWVRRPGFRPIPGHEWARENQWVFALAAAAFVASLPRRWRASPGPGLLYFAVAVAMFVALVADGFELHRINASVLDRDAPYERGAGFTFAWAAVALHAVAGLDWLRRRPPRADTRDRR